MLDTTITVTKIWLILDLSINLKSCDFWFFFPPGLNYAIWAATTCMLFELWMKLNDLGKNIDKHYSSIGQL